jgi:hypothetical protein
MDDMDDILIEYQISFEHGGTEIIALTFDADDMSAAGLGQVTPIDDDSWTDLENQQCRHCPLNREDSPKCPVASNLGWIVHRFKDHQSFEKVSTTVQTRERTYAKDTDLQSVMYSIFGLVMASSTCPHMAFLKPMARFHLPFASIDETMMRSASIFLLGQYFLNEDGSAPDFDLQRFKECYENLNVINNAMIQRIRGIGKGDIHPNAIVVLDSLATILSYEISDDLSSLEKYF